MFYWYVRLQEFTQVLSQVVVVYAKRRNDWSKRQNGVEFSLFVHFGEAIDSG